VIELFSGLAIAAEDPVFVFSSRQTVTPLRLSGSSSRRQCSRERMPAYVRATR